jgi:hypothetical protein
LSPVAAVFGRHSSLSRDKSSRPTSLCRPFVPLSLPLNQKSRKTFGTIKKSPYLCGVKTEQQVLHDKQTIILTIKKYTTMYAIAFFATVFVFSATLFIYDALRNYKSRTAKSDLDITPDHHIGTFRRSA